MHVVCTGQGNMKKINMRKKKSVISLNGIIEEGLGHFLYSVDFHMPGEKIFITYRYKKTSFYCIPY